MKVITSGRQTGRTTELINRAAKAEENGKICYIVCHSHGEAYRISKLAEHLGKQIGFPITYQEFLDRSYAGQNIDHFLIDNAEFLLQQLTPVRIDTVVIEGC